MQNIDYATLRQKLDSLLNGYHLQEAVGILKSLDLKSIPAKMRADYSQLARRAHMYKEAIKILQDNVVGVGQPNPKDIIEYASSLRKLGMIQQCQNLLQRVPSHKDKFLYQAFCHVHNWDYSNAYLDFSIYLSQEGLSERERIVALLNLASCCIYTKDLEQAESILFQIEDICREKYFQFYLNCLEMKGQLAIAHGRLMEASSILAYAQDLSKKETGTTSLFIEKWKLIAELPLNTSEWALAKINEFKKNVRLQGHWETLRDFDYHVAVFQKNHQAIDQVYFGTPFPSYKKRIKDSFQGLIGSKYLWQGKIENAARVYQLDPMDVSSELVPFGLVQHRLLLVLLSDVYRPWSLQRIFDNLFPDEMYDVNSSPKRIYGLIKKLQDSLQFLDLPFELLSTIHGYRFRHKTDSAIVVYDQMQFTSPQQILSYALEHKYKIKEFTPQSLAKALSVSSHKAYRWIHDMEESHLVQRDPNSHKLIIKAA